MKNESSINNYLKSLDNVDEGDCVKKITFAGLGVWLEDEALGTGARVAAWGVPTQAVVTQQAIHQTLVNICGKAFTFIRANTNRKETVQ